MFQSFLKGLAKGLVAVGKGVLIGAKFVSAHPEVLAKVADAAVALGAPVLKVGIVADKVGVGSAIVSGVAAAVEQAKGQD